MNIRQAILLLAGVILMSETGSTLSHRLGLGKGDWTLTLFALGIVFISMSYFWTVQSKLQSLENRLKQLESKPETPLVK